MKLEQLKSLIIKQYELSESETLMRDIIIGLLEKDETEVILAPISQMYYISNEKLQYYIKIMEFHIDITNHKFTISHAINPKFAHIIISILREYMETNRKEFEKTVFQNQIHLLKNIKNTLYPS